MTSIAVPGDSASSALNRACAGTLSLTRDGPTTRTAGAGGVPSGAGVLNSSPHRVEETIAGPRTQSDGA